MHSGKKIKLLRNLKNISQEQLGEKINKTRALVSHIEQSGKVNHYTLTSILKVLNISHTEFESFTGEDVLKGAFTNSIAEIKLLLDKIEYLQKENDLLKNLVDSQKKLIEALGEKRNRRKKQ